MTTQEQTAQHTPGPWRIDPDDDTTWRILGPGEGGRLQNEICELAYVGGNAEANARLIAAAPVLLAALEACLRDVRTPGFGGGIDQQTEEQARAAIARAKGEPR